MVINTWLNYKKYKNLYDSGKNDAILALGQEFNSSLQKYFGKIEVRGLNDSDVKELAYNLNLILKFADTILKQKQVEGGIFRNWLALVKQNHGKPEMYAQVGHSTKEFWERAEALYMAILAFAATLTKEAWELDRSNRNDFKSKTRNMASMLRTLAQVCNAFFDREGKLLLWREAVAAGA